MKCRYCGRQIPEGMLYCEYCGNEVRIVPDYNPLDEMLAEQVKVSINGQNNTGRVNTGRTNTARTNTGRTNTGRTSACNTRNHSSRNGSGQRRSATGRMPVDEREQRRRQAERRKAAKRKKRRKLLTIMVVILALIVGLSVLLYMNSYTGIVKKGYKSLQSQEYNEAIACFEKAINKNAQKRDAYDGLSQVYIQKNDFAKAEKVFLEAIEAQPDNADIYEACIEFYLNTDQVMEIPALLEDAKDSVREALSEYIIDIPEYSLSDETVYDDVQQLSLESSAGDVYYTTDGKDPTTSSQKYTEPIQLSEGETIIKAITVNKKGVPSLTVTKTYVIEFPMVDAPAVSPSTGQYEQYTEITIKVPDGYDAYYTMDGSDPTTASTKYTGPIDMPEGEVLFKVMLVDANGRTSGITTRNYVLDLPDEEE